MEATKWTKVTGCTKCNCKQNEGESRYYAMSFNYQKQEVKMIIHHDYTLSSSKNDTDGINFRARMEIISQMNGTICK
jgi:hypothetical protein